MEQTLQDLIKGTWIERVNPGITFNQFEESLDDDDLTEDDLD